MKNYFVLKPKKLLYKSGMVSEWVMIADLVKAEQKNGMFKWVQG